MRTVLCIGLLLICGVPASFAQESREAFAKSYQYERVQSYGEAIKVLLPLKDNYFVQLRLGWLHYLGGNYANAKQSYQAAIQAAPKAVEPRLGYTLPLLAQERYEEVETVTRAVLAMDANNYLASLRLAFALRMQGKLAPAHDLNAAMIELYPTDVTFLTEQLLVATAQKNAEEQRKLCDLLLMLDPENITAKRILAPPSATSVPALKINGG